jgi:hypothetical protein
MQSCASSSLQPSAWAARAMEARAHLSRPLNVVQLPQGPAHRWLADGCACQYHWRACAQNPDSDEAWTSWKMPEDVPPLDTIYSNGAAEPRTSAGDNGEATLAQVLRADTVRLQLPVIL